MSSFSTFLSSLTLILCTISAAERAVNVNINAISEDINKLIEEKSPLAFSSNPYDYIKNNESFDNIVAIGADALPIIKKKIAESENNGLREYILAIAAEKIAKVDLKGDNFGWDTAKGWEKKWNKHLKDLPNNYKNIIESKASTEDKSIQISKLGTPAIPLILDDIEEGNTSLVPALQKLVECDISSVKDFKEWAKSNKSKYQNLRDIVDSAQ